MKRSVVFLYLIPVLFTAQISAALLTIISDLDGGIRESNNSGSFSSQQMLFGRLGTDSDLTGLLSFDLDQPELSGASIHSVSLRLTLNAADGSNSADETTTLDLYQVLTPFNANATWTNRDGTNSWNSPGALGADRGSDLLASYSGNAALANTGDTLSFSSEAAFTTLVSSNIGNTLALGAYMDSGSTRALFRVNSNNTLVAVEDRPTLIIDYTAIPEPSSFLLISAALLLGWGTLRRRN